MAAAELGDSLASQAAGHEEKQGKEEVDEVEQQVFAFFHSSSDPGGHQFVHVSEDTEESPVVGLSAGWLKASVLEDAEHAGAGGAGCVRVAFGGRFWGPRAGSRHGLAALVPAALVVRGAPPPPLLSLLCVRGVRGRDDWSDPLPSDRGAACDGVASQLFDGPGGVHGALAGEYELHTAWVGGPADLAAIGGEAVLRRLRAPHLAACYFLRPRRVSQATMPAGCVDEFGLFDLMQRLERAGVPSGWPAPAHVHRLLAGKFWAPQMCLNPDVRLPATTRVHYAEFAEDKEPAARRAIGALLELRSSLGPSAPRPREEELLGVVKLGYSWRGEGVLPFRGVASLVEALEHLLSSPDSMQTVCIVQEMVPDVVCELRLLCFHDAADPSGERFVKECVWVRMGRHGEVHPRNRSFSDRVPEFAMALEGDDGIVGDDAALDEFFGGSQQSMARAQELAEALSEQWLLWFSCECPEPPAAVRLDFLVERSAGQGGRTDVWTSEIGECGSSVCGAWVGVRNTAVLNATLRDERETGRFPKGLPVIA